MKKLQIGTGKLLVFEILCVTALAMFTPSTAPAQALIDVESLIREVSEDRQEGAFSGYSYKLEFVRRKRGLFGTQKLTKRYEAILPFSVPKKRRYAHPMLLTYDSSRNLKATDIVSERRRLIKMLERIESGKFGTPDESKKNENVGGYVALRASSDSAASSLKIDLIDLVNNSVFLNPKDLWLNGRATVSLEFRPRADSVYEEDMTYLKQVGGLLFIDKNDKRIVAVEGFPLGLLERMKSLPPDERELFSVFYYQQTRVPEGFWFPEKVKLNLMDVPPEFGDLNIAVDFKFSDYQRSLVQVRSAEVDPLDDAGTEN